MLMQPSGGGAVLLHQYTYGDGPVAIGDYSGFVDEVGSFDLHTGNGNASYYQGDISNTDAARNSWNVWPGDSFTCVFSGVYRTTRYPQAYGFNFSLSGAKQQNAGSLGRSSSNRIFAVMQDTVNSANAVPLDVRYYETSGSSALKNSSELTCVPQNGTPVEIKLVYDSSTGRVRTFVDGVVYNDFVHANPSLVHIDGLAMSVANLYTNQYWGFSQIKIFSGINI